MMATPGAGWNGRRHRFAERGELVCVRCGLVLGPVFSFDPPRGDESFQRAWDLATEDGHSNLGTEIYPLPQNARISPEIRAWWDRVRKTLSRETSADRRLHKMIAEISRVSRYMGLPYRARRDLWFAAQKLSGHMRGYSRLRTLAALVNSVCARNGRKAEEVDRAFQEMYGEEYARARGGWPSCTEQCWMAAHVAEAEKW